MSAGTFELTRAERLLWSILGDDAAITAEVGANVYPYVAPTDLLEEPDGKPPGVYVVFGLLGAADDVRVLGTGPDTRAIAGGTYVVKAVGPVAGTLELEALADAIDAALHGAAGDVGGLRITVTRLRPVSYPEVVAGRLYWHLGGQYALEIT